MSQKIEEEKSKKKSSLVLNFFGIVRGFLIKNPSFIIYGFKAAHGVIGVLDITAIVACNNILEKLKNCKIFLDGKFARITFLISAIRAAARNIENANSENINNLNETEFKNKIREFIRETSISFDDLKDKFNQ